MGGRENGRDNSQVAAVGNARRSELRNLLVGAAVKARNDRWTLVENARQTPQPRIRDRVVLLLCGMT